MLRVVKSHTNQIQIIQSEVDEDLLLESNLIFLEMNKTNLKNKIINGNCLEEIKKIPDKSF